MVKDRASFNGSYGLFAKHCTGGKITDAKAWGHGDSGIYIGETPPQKNPKWTDISNNKVYENVLGYSGTNSKYVDIHDNWFYNNGAGVVPNTLESELFQPNADGKIRNNKIFWNNFNYFLPKSPVKTVSGGLGTIGDPPRTINYPTGIGVVLFGSDSWLVKDNDIFGNFMWGAASFSDGLNPRPRPEPEQPLRRQHDGSKRHGHEPVRLLQRRFHGGELLRGQSVVHVRHDERR